MDNTREGKLALFSHADFSAWCKDVLGDETEAMEEMLERPPDEFPCVVVWRRTSTLHQWFFFQYVYKSDLGA